MPIFDQQAAVFTDIVGFDMAWENKEKSLTCSNFHL